MTSRGVAVVADTDVKIAMAALYEAMGVKRRLIAEYLNVGETRASELVTAAKERGWLLGYTDIPEKIRSAALDQLDVTEILNQFGYVKDGALRKFVVCDGVEPRIACAEITAIDLAPQLSERVVGIAWGLSVLEFAKHVSAPRKERLKGKFVPVCGDPLGIPMPRAAASASAICEILNRAAQCMDWQSMIGIPAFFPGNLDRSIILACKRAFGGPEKEIQALITGIGGTPLGYDGDLLLRSTGITRDAVERCVLGDLAGVLIPRVRLKEPEAKTLTDLQFRWTGLSLEDLKIVARRDPGVVVIATAADKLDVLMEAMRMSLVTRVYASRDLFRGIKERMEQKGWNPPSRVVGGSA